MKLTQVRTTWGISEFGNESSWSDALSAIKQEGYEAIEAVGVFCYNSNPKLFKSLLEAHGLRLIVQVHTSAVLDKGYVYISSYRLEPHLESFREQLVAAKEMDPVLVNVHAGHDGWDHETSVAFLLEAQAIADELGVKVCFETHRQRLFYNPYSTKALLSDPRLNGRISINADLSHWAVVCGNVFDEQAERDRHWWPQLLQLVAEHCVLIHNRFGDTETPQIADPRDPAEKHTVQQHLKWWKTIWDNQQKRGMEESFNEVEHGPAPYVQVLPYSRVPVVDLREVNNAVRDLVRSAFVDKFPEE